MNFVKSGYLFGVVLPFISGCIAVILIFMTSVYSQSESANVPPEWQTVAEKTDYHKTSTYDETIVYCKKLDLASPLIT